MNVITLFANRYVRHTLTAVSGYLVAKGVIDTETAGATVEAVTNFTIASGLGAVALFFSKLSDKLK